MATPDLNPSLDHWRRNRATASVRESRGPERVTNETHDEPVVRRPVGFTAVLEATTPEETPAAPMPVPDDRPLLWEGDEA